MYLTASYTPASLFSLRESQASNVVASTYLHPSPYCVKMTLASLFLQIKGVEQIDEWITFLKNLEVFIEGPKYVVVNHSMIKIRKYNDKASKELLDLGMNINSPVSYREFAYLGGDVRLAFRLEQISEGALHTLKECLMHVRYFGNRGSFFQWTGFTTLTSLPNSFSFEIHQTYEADRLSLLKRMDDFSEGLNFDQINIYSETKATQARKEKVYVLPYSRLRSNHRYTFYCRGE